MITYVRRRLASIALIAVIGILGPSHIDQTIKPNCFTEAAGCGQTPEPTLPPTAPPKQAKLFLPFIVANNCDCIGFTDVGMP